jgi:hypothetical protein
MNAFRGIGGIGPVILNLCTRWSESFRFPRNERMDVKRVHDFKEVNIIAQYLKLHSDVHCIGVILKGCAVYCVHQKPFEIYCKGKVFPLHA